MMSRGLRLSVVAIACLVLWSVACRMETGWAPEVARRVSELLATRADRMQTQGGRSSPRWRSSTWTTR